MWARRDIASPSGAHTKRHARSKLIPHSTERAQLLILIASCVSGVGELHWMTSVSGFQVRLPRFVTRLVPRFRAELKAGTRIVSHDYPLAPWPPDKELSMDVPEKEMISGTSWTRLYYYVVPARVQGVWELILPKSLAGAPLVLQITQELSRLGDCLECIEWVVKAAQSCGAGHELRHTLCTCTTYRVRLEATFLPDQASEELDR